MTCYIYFVVYESLLYSITVLCVDVIAVMIYLGCSESGFASLTMVWKREAYYFGRIFFDFIICGFSSFFFRFDLVWF